MAASSAPKSTGGQRKLEIHIGPLDHPEQADAIVDLFRDIAGLGTIQTVPTDDTSKRVFAVETTSSDGDLIDLFAFHVAKENISIVDLDAAAPVAAAGRETLKQDAGFGLFDDLPASAPALARLGSGDPASA